MPFLTLDDGFSDHPKIDALSHGAFRLHVCGLVYCARHLTDGHIHINVVSRLMPVYRSSYVAELVKARLWTLIGDTYEIHDYLDWNRSHDWWTQRRADQNRRQAESRERRRKQ